MKQTFLAVFYLLVLFTSNFAFAQFVLPPIGIVPTPGSQPLFGDSKVHAGSFCQPLVGAQANRINTVSFGIENIGPFDTTVTCPILRDNTRNTTGTFTDRGSKGVILRVFNPGGRLPCTLFSINPFSNVVATNSASTNQVGARTFSLAVNTSSSGGQYSIICTLPPGGRVYSYLVKEFRPTDTN